MKKVVACFLRVGFYLHRQQRAGEQKTKQNTENMKKEHARIADRNAKHSYEIETKDGYVIVDADTRSQAAKRAKQAGHEVLSVNFIG